MHDQYIIQGGQPLAGEVTLSGAKNLANKLMIASLLASKPCTLNNVPDIGEIDIVQRIIETTGAQVERHGQTVTIDPTTLTHSDLGAVTSNRIPILAAGPLLHRTGHAVLPMPGGDKIGRRPVNFHIDALRALGATISEHDGLFVLEAKSLRGAAIRLPFPSVGATENILIAATTATGVTEISNAAIEPEILELVRFLRDLGAQIEQSHRTFRITGVDTLGSATYTVIPDRIEAVSYIALAVASRGEISIQQARLANIEAYLPLLDTMGVRYRYKEDALVVSATDSQLRPATITTGVHPGFLSDWQQPSAVALLTIPGTSTIHETVFEDRFGYLRDLETMGATIEVSTDCRPAPCRYQGQGFHHVATLHGPTEFSGAQIQLRDIRAGIAQMIAALIARGPSTLSGIEHLDRGYGRHLENNLRGLGASIERVERPT